MLQILYYNVLILLEIIMNLNYHIFNENLLLWNHLYFHDISDLYLLLLEMLVSLNCPIFLAHLLFLMDCYKINSFFKILHNHLFLNYRLVIFQYLIILVIRFQFLLTMSRHLLNLFNLFFHRLLKFDFKYPIYFIKNHIQVFTFFSSVSFKLSCCFRFQ